MWHVPLLCIPIPVVPGSCLGCILRCLVGKARDLRWGWIWHSLGTLLLLSNPSKARGTAGSWPCLGTVRCSYSSLDQGELVHGDPFAGRTSSSIQAKRPPSFLCKHVRVVSRPQFATKRSLVLLLQALCANSQVRLFPTVRRPCLTYPLRRSRSTSRLCRKLSIEARIFRRHENLDTTLGPPDEKKLPGG